MDDQDDPLFAGLALETTPRPRTTVSSPSSAERQQARRPAAEEDDLFAGLSTEGSSSRDRFTVPAGTFEKETHRPTFWEQFLPTGKRIAPAIAGSMTGAKIGSVVPGWGTLAGAVVGGGVGGFGGEWWGQEEEIAQGTRSELSPKSMAVAGAFSAVPGWGTAKTALGGAIRRGAEGALLSAGEDVTREVVEGRRPTVGGALGAAGWGAAIGGPLGGFEGAGNARKLRAKALEDPLFAGLATQAADEAEAPPIKTVTGTRIVPPDAAAPPAVTTPPPTTPPGGGGTGVAKLPPVMIDALRRRGMPQGDIDRLTVAEARDILATKTVTVEAKPKPGDEGDLPLLGGETPPPVAPAGGGGAAATPPAAPAGKIGPYKDTPTDQLFRMVREGEKPAMAVSSKVTADRFPGLGKAAEQAGLTVHDDGTHLIVAKDAETATQLAQAIAKRDHATVGRLLGYSEPDVQAFLAQQSSALRTGVKIEPLPKDLRGAKPRYKDRELTFESDVDRAAYIIAQAKPSPRDADYLAYFMAQTGLDEAASRAHGAEVRKRIGQVVGATDEQIVTIPAGSMPRRKAAPEAEAPKPAVETPVVPPAATEEGSRTLYHGTTAANYDKIQQSGRFDANASRQVHPEVGGYNDQRVWEYSVAGPDTVYFARDKSTWVSPEWEASGKSEGYEKVVEAALDPSAKIAKVSSPAELDALAQRAGFKDLNDFADQVYVESVMAGGEDAAELARARKAIRQFIDQTGYDGIEFTPGWKVPRFGGDQVMVFDPTKVKPVKDAPTPAVSPKATPAETPPAGTSGVAEVPPESIKVDPARFQFKSHADAEGVTPTARIGGPWNENLGGVLLVWKDPTTGETFVVNGHHRLEAAKRLGAKKVLVRYVTDKTPEQARVTGALANIAEDKGTAVDAAKVLKATEMSSNALAAVGVSPKVKLAREGMALAHLSDPLFERVATGSLDEGVGVAIGQANLTPENQMAVVQLLERVAAKGRELTPGQVRALIQDVQTAPSVTKVDEQQNMFTALLGEDRAQSVAVEKAVLRDWLQTTLAKDKRLFGYVAKGDRAARLATAGNKIDVKASQAVSEQAARVAAVVDRLSQSKGPINDALNAAAARVAGGESLSAIKPDLLAAVRAGVESELAGGVAGPRPGADAGSPPATQGPHPGGDRPPSGGGVVPDLPEDIRVGSGAKLSEELVDILESERREFDQTGQPWYWDFRTNTFTPKGRAVLPDVRLPYQQTQDWMDAIEREMKNHPPGAPIVLPKGPPPDDPDMMQLFGGMGALPFKLKGLLKRWREYGDRNAAPRTQTGGAGAPPPKPPRGGGIPSPSGRTPPGFGPQSVPAIERAARAAGTPIPKAEPLSKARIEGEQTFIKKFPEDVQQPLSEMFAMQKHHEMQRQGVQPDLRVEALADWIDVNATEVAPKGTTMSAPQIRAYANTLTWTLDEMNGLAEKSRLGQATTEDNVNLVRLISQGMVLTSTIKGVRGEMGRGLRSFGQVTRVMKSKDVAAMEALIKEATRSGMDPREIATVWGGLTTPIQKMAFLKSLNQAGAMDWLKGMFFSNILSGPRTHLRNMIGNTSNAAFRALSQPAALGWDVAKSKLTGAERTIYAGEASHRARGAAVGALKGWSDAMFSLEHGFTRNDLGTFDVARKELQGGAKNPFNWTGRALEAEDQFFYSVNYHSELYARLFAHGKKLKIPANLMDETLANWTLAPPKEIHEAANTAALHAVYKEKGGKFVEGLTTLKSKNPILDFFLPFVRTPGNLLRQGIEGTPLGLLTAQTRGALKAGGRDQAEAIGRMLTGTAALSGLAWWAGVEHLSGTGPKDPEERAALMRDGWKPNAVKIGSAWIPFADLAQPLSQPLFAIANAFDLFKGGEGVDPQRVALAAGGSILDQSFLAGVSDLNRALSDEERYGDQFIQRWAQSWVPFSGLNRNISQAIDPVVREPAGVLEGMQSILPVASQGVAPKIGTLGEQIERQGGPFLRGLSPVSPGFESGDPVVRELSRLGVNNIAVPAKKLRATGRFPEIELTIAERQQIGQATKAAIERLIRSPNFGRYNEVQARDRISDAVQTARTRVTGQIRQAHQQAARR